MTEAVTRNRPDQEKATPPHVRAAHDADDIDALKRHPDDPDAKLDVALDESFPTSDPPSNTQPCGNTDPAPSSGYDEEAEKERMAGKE